MKRTTLLLATAAAVAAVVWFTPTGAAGDPAVVPTSLPPVTSSPSPTPVEPTTTTTEPTATTTTVDPSAPPASITPEVPPPPGADHSGGGSGGFFDIGGKVRDAIDSWFSRLAMAALNPALDLLGRTVFSTPNFTGEGRVRDLWQVSWAIANSIFVLFVVGAGALGMSHETLQTRFALKDLIPRLAVAFVTANGSLFVVGAAINLGNGVSQGLASQGIGEASGALGLVLTAMGSGGFFAIFGLVVAVLALGVLGTYVGRLATMVVLVGGAPLFLVAHALPGADGLARLWWRALAGCLAVQMGQSLVLVTAVRVLFDADGRRTAGMPGGPLMDLLVVASLLWLMLKIPGYARGLILSPRPNMGGRLARMVAIQPAASAARRAFKAVG